MTSSSLGCADLKLNACRAASCRVPDTAYCAYMELCLLPCDAEDEILSQYWISVPSVALKVTTPDFLHHHQLPC